MILSIDQGCGNEKACVARWFYIVNHRAFDYSTVTFSFRSFKKACAPGFA